MAVAVTLPESVADLVARARSGDRQAETTLSQRFAPVVRAFARRRLRSAEACDDFAQDVLLLLVEALRRGSIEEPARLGGFVLGICKKLALDRARTRERRDALWQQFGSALGALTPAEVARQHLHEVVHLEDCLSQLSGRARDIVRMGFVEGESHAAIASALGVSENNARILRHRTLSSLRECMQNALSWEHV